MINSDSRMGFHPGSQVWGSHTDRIDSDTGSLQESKLSKNRPTNTKLEK